MKKLIFSIFIQTILVILVLAGAFYITGSPGEAKKIALDSQRMRAFTDIYYVVETYSSNNQKLPNSLDQLKLRPNQITDPESKKTYDFETVNANTFKLCTTFSTDSDKQPDYLKNFGQSGQDFSYSAGYNCLEFKINSIYDTSLQVPEPTFTTDLQRVNIGPEPDYVVQEIELKGDFASFNGLYDQINIIALDGSQKVYNLSPLVVLRNEAGQDIFTTNFAAGDNLLLYFDPSSNLVNKVVNQSYGTN